VTPVERLGVVGAGTMGSGIAQIACLGGFETYLHDPIEEALASGEERLRAGLAKGAERGRWSHEDAEAAAGRLRPAGSLEDLAPCDLVIEAAPEDLPLKRELFARLSEICGEHVILATNTSSLQVSEMATAAAHPERVCGMHFFNPPPLMELVEIVAGADTSDEVLEAATEAGRRMGRTPIRASDGPGFLANRVARPFGLEALRLMGDGVAGHEQIDRICRIGGFRMGPFELMDLVGVDVGFEVSKSFWEQSFHEPRWQPHTIQARMAASGRHGRKAGRGYYDYSQDPYRPEDPPLPEPSDTPPTVEIDGEGALVEELGSRVVASEPVPEPQARLVFLAEGSVAELDEAGGGVGFHALGPLDEVRVVELTRGAMTSDGAAESAAAFFRALGKHVEWVGDAPGLVLGRIVCQVVNEAAFAVQKAVGTPEDVDTAMRLGFNYPRGPLEWGDAIGLDHVLAILDALREETGEEKYRAAPLLRRMVAEGKLGRSTGEGFFSHSVATATQSVPPPQEPLTNREIVLRMIDAFRSGDSESPFRYIAPEVEWDAQSVPFFAADTFPPDMQRVYRGHEGIRQFWRGWLSAFDVDFDVEDVVEVDDSVMCWIPRQTLRGRDSGIEFDVAYAWLYTFRGGQLVRVAFFETKAEALAAAKIHTQAPSEEAERLSNREIVVGMFEAFARRDNEWPFLYYDPQVVLDATRAGQIPHDLRDVYVGHEGIRSFWSQWLSPWQSIETELEDVVLKGDAVVSTMHAVFRGRESGIDSRLFWAWHWQFEDGRVVSVAFYDTKEQALAAAERE
jgi:3-hydroxybutyryl-CoA dehydrogenase